MRASRKFLLLTLSAALVLGASGADKKDKAKDEGKPGSSKKAKAEKATPAPAPDASAPAPTAEAAPKPAPKLSIPLPRGQDSRGVTIPFSDATGKRSMLFKIGVGTRLDEENVKMADLTIQTYDSAGKPEMTIEMPTSNLNLTTRTIVGDQNVTIKREDFQLTGSTMEFNTDSKQGWVKGNVKMIIYDLREQAGDNPAPKKEGEGS